MSTCGKTTVQQKDADDKNNAESTINVEFESGTNATDPTIRIYEDDNTQLIPGKKAKSAVWSYTKLMDPQSGTWTAVY